MVIDEATNEVNLTLHEQSILFLLAENSPRIYSREEIIDAVSINEGPNSVRAVDTTICRLRKKLECNAKKPAHIKTVNGLGYRLLLTASV
jgi:DNA-binding response OmpR family regulator